MSDLLAIIDPITTDEELVAEIIRRHGDRVTLLLEADGADWASDDSPRGRALRDRLSRLRAAIEAGGAMVVGLVSSREQLRGWRFDRTIGGSAGAPAVSAI